MTFPNEVKARLEEGINEWLLNFDEIAEAGMIFFKFKEFLREKEKSSKEGYTIRVRSQAIS